MKDPSPSSNDVQFMIGGGIRCTFMDYILILVELMKFYNYWGFFCFHMDMIMWSCMMIGNDI